MKESFKCPHGTTECIKIQRISLRELWQKKIH